MKRLDFNLGQGIVAFSTERDTNCPENPYDGFSACHYTGDATDHVVACRNLVRGYLNARELVIPKQNHSLEVVFVDHIPVGPLDGVDGIVTTLSDVALAVNTADCVPVLMADAGAGVIAAVHSGWRGTVGHIACKALALMVKAGAQVQHVRVVMGPSICPGCFEVGEEVAEEFDRAFNMVDGIVLRRPDGGKPHIDLRQAIRHDLVDLGVLPSNIDIDCAPCSRCDWTRWWSARRMGINSGRTLTVIKKITINN